MMDGGTAPFSKVAEKRSRNLAYLADALGPEAGACLRDPKVTDIILNPPRRDEAEGRLWVVRIGEEAKHIGFMDAGAAERLIVAVASMMDKQATSSNAVVEGVLSIDGSRFTGMLRPIVPQPSFAIRKPTSQVIPLERYVAMGAMTEKQKARIETAVSTRENIILCGGTGTGKTTLGNAILGAMAALTPNDRVAGVEENTAELQCPLANAVFMQSDVNHPVSLLVKTVLRLFPTRIIVGEVRGPEALQMLMNWNTGHPGGFCTLHSNVGTPSSALERLEDLVAMATTGDMRRMIGEAVDLIICLELTASHRRRVSQIVSVRGYDKKRGDYTLEVEGN